MYLFFSMFPLNLQHQVNKDNENSTACGMYTHAVLVLIHFKSHFLLMYVRPVCHSN